jgi:hypothetical protein
LAFFAVADWVFTARLAGYVAILETPDAMLRPSTPTMPPLPPLPPLPPVQNTIDKDELILSDLLNLVPETPQGTS